jgi:zinc D-Ala-D-Ala carboxypeptidase
MSDEWRAKHFKRSEFACRCGCGFDDIDLTLVDHLDYIRETLGMPMTINSGCRCEAYNKLVGGKGDSAHTRGKAADTAIHGTIMRFTFVSLALKRGIKRLGIYDTFCHTDVSEDLPQYVMWTG